MRFIKFQYKWVLAVACCWSTLQFIPDAFAGQRILSSFVEEASDTTPQTISDIHYGVLVGIDKYLPEVADSLPSCVNDAVAMRTNLLFYGKWQTERTALLTNSAATKANIRAAIVGMASEAKAGDVALFYQSSHGGRQEGTDVYLCTHDGVYSRR